MNNSIAVSDDQTAALLLESLQAGATLKDLHGLSDELLEGVYAHAHRFYESGQLDQAESFFRFLCLYDFYNGEYAMGLAAVYQVQRKYEKAIDVYALAFALTKQDYRPMFHVGQCHLSLRKVHVARECFSLVVAKSSDDGLVKRAQTYLDAMIAAECNAAENGDNE